MLTGIMVFSLQGLIMKPKTIARHSEIQAHLLYCSACISQVDVGHCKSLQRFGSSYVCVFFCLIIEVVYDI